MSMRRNLSVFTLCAVFMISAPALAQEHKKGLSAVNNEVSSFEVKEAKDGTLIRVRGSSVPTFSVFKLSAPPRLFIDIANSKAKTVLPRTISNGVISRVALVGVKNGGQNIARVIVGFEKPSHYDVRTEGNDVVIFIDGSKRRKAPADRAKEDAKFQAALKDLSSTKNKLSKAQGEVTKLRAQIAAAQGNAKKKLQAELALRNDALNKAKLEKSQAQKRVTHLESDREKALARATKAEQLAAKERARTSKLKSDLDLASKQKRTLTRDLEASRSKSAQVARDLETKKQDLVRANTLLKTQKQQVAQAQQRAKDLETQLKKLRARATSGDTSAKKELAAFEQQHARTVQALEKQKRETQAAQQRYLAMQKDLQARDAELANLRAKLAKANTPKTTGVPARAVAVDPTAPNVVRGIKLETHEGRSRIVVELDRPDATYETLPGSSSRAVMILNNVKLPKQLEKTLSSRTHSGAVRFVSSFVQNGQVRMEAELGANTSETIRKDGNKLVWEFAPVMAQKQAPAQPQEVAEASPQAPTQGQSFTSAPPMVVVDPTKVTRVPGLSRRRLTLDLRDVDVQNVLRLIAKEGGINIIAGDDVGGSITIRLRSVSLEQAFLTILQTRQLGFEMRGNVLRVAPQKTLLAEQQARAEARKKAQGLKPLEVFLLPINYASAKELTPQVQGLLSGRGSVTVDTRTNILIIKDIAENIGAIRGLIETLDAQVPQVLIEARIVETNDTFTQQFGIQWGGDFGFSQTNGNPTGLIFPSVLGVAGAAQDGQAPIGGLATTTPNYAINLPAAIGTGAGGGIGLTLGSVGGAVNLSLRLSAAEAAGSARIVSSPKIMTLDNRTATISQGTSIPISVVSAAGVQTVFVDATLELTVTPHVTPDGNVQMQIRATKNEPDFQNTGARGDPTIIRRQANTELLIKDGDTTVIGGIYTRNSGSSLSAVPLLHKIPILGFFFKTTSESERRGELLIFITPRIINRAQALGVTQAGVVRDDGAGNTATKK